VVAGGDSHLGDPPGHHTDSVGSNLSAGTPKLATFFDKLFFVGPEGRGARRVIEKNVFFRLPLLVQLFAFDFSLRDTTCLGDLFAWYCTIVFNKFE